MRLPVHIWIRQENAHPRQVAEYFVELARRLDARPEPMRLHVESTVPASLDFNPKTGNPVVSVCGKSCEFDIRRRWLPEHPLPLVFGSKEKVLLVDPVDGNRFRVRSGRRIAFSGALYALLAVSGSVAAVTVHFAAVFVTVAIIAVMLFLKCKRKSTAGFAVRCF